jgi:hypothetical protein
LSSGSAATPDLPFSAPVISYIAHCLEIAGIEPDRPWLKFEKPEAYTAAWNPGVIMARQDLYASLPFARKAIPRSLAFWELGPFFEAAISPAAFDLSQAVITDYPAFRFLYARLLGSASIDWLPSLYLAAAAVPNLNTVHRAKLIDGFVPDILERDF